MQVCDTKCLIMIILCGLRDNHFIESGGSYLSKDDKEHKPSDQSRSSKADDLHSLPRLKKENYDKVGLPPNAIAFDPSWPSSKGQESISSSDGLSEGVVPIKTQGTAIVVSRPSSSSASKGQEKTGSSNEPSEGSLPPKIRGTTTAVAQPSSSSSSTSDRVSATSSSTGRGLSPSSSVSSFSSEKSTLNPHAKEFKCNPNAKRFIPNQTPLRISSPVADSSFYYPTNMTAVTHMHGMPICVGLGPYFASQQPVIFNPQAAASAILSSDRTSVWAADDNCTTSASHVHASISTRNAIQWKGILADEGVSAYKCSK